MTATRNHHPNATEPEDDPTMRAIVQDRYGAPDVLTLRAIPRPTARSGEPVWI